MTEKLGNNFRGKAEAVRVLRDYVKIKQGHNVIILTDNAVRKLARMTDIRLHHGPNPHGDHCSRLPGLLLALSALSGSFGY